MALKLLTGYDENAGGKGYIYIELDGGAVVFNGYDFITFNGEKRRINSKDTGTWGVDVTWAGIAPNVAFATTPTVSSSYFDFVAGPGFVYNGNVLSYTDMGTYAVMQLDGSDYNIGDQFELYGETYTATAVSTTTNSNDTVTLDGKFSFNIYASHDSVNITSAGGGGGGGGGGGEPEAALYYFGGMYDSSGETADSVGGSSSPDGLYFIGVVDANGDPVTGLPVGGSFTSEYALEDPEAEVPVEAVAVLGSETETAGIYQLTSGGQAWWIADVTDNIIELGDPDGNEYPDPLVYTAPNAGDGGVYTKPTKPAVAKVVKPAEVAEVTKDQSVPEVTKPSVGKVTIG